MNPEETRRCILVIDDDYTIRAMLELALGEAYRLVCLPDGGGVLKAIESYDPALLLLDVNLAGEDGFEVCERVRSHKGARRLPILFMTVRRDLATLMSSLGAGGDAQIEKPFDIPALRAKIEGLLGPKV